MNKRFHVAFKKNERDVLEKAEKGNILEEYQDQRSTETLLGRKREGREKKVGSPILPFRNRLRLTD